MKNFHLVYKIKNPKTEKSCVVDRLKMAYNYLNKKRFIKSLPSCKYVNPLGSSYLKSRRERFYYNVLKYAHMELVALASGRS